MSDGGRSGPTEEELEEILEGIEREKEEWDPHDLPESQAQLVRDLDAAGAPEVMVVRTGLGHYHDYVSEHPSPKHLLVHHCQQHGLDEIVARAKQGAYDP